MMSEPGNGSALPRTRCFYAFDVDIKPGDDIRLSELHPVGFPLRRSGGPNGEAIRRVDAVPVPMDAAAVVAENLSRKRAADAAAVAAAREKRPRVASPAAAAGLPPTGTDADFEDIPFDEADFELADGETMPPA